MTQICTIPRPKHLSIDLYHTPDGSSSGDPLLGSSTDGAPLFHDNKTFRDRIYARYITQLGLSYRDGTNLPDLLPRSDTSLYARRHRPKEHHGRRKRPHLGLS
jgi:hypothetical protein